MIIDMIMLSYSHVIVDHHQHQDNFYLYKDSFIIGWCVDALLPSYHLCLHWEPQGNYQHLHHAANRTLKLKGFPDQPRPHLPH